MEVNKENIEFVKLKLREYGYYTKRIEECQRELDDISSRIKDCYHVSGLRYDQPMNSSNPYFSRIHNILLEEGEVQTKKDNWQQKRNELNLDNLLSLLNAESYELVKLHYFDNFSQGYIAVNKQYSTREKLTKKFKRIVTFLVKRY